MSAAPGTGAETARPTGWSRLGAVLAFNGVSAVAMLAAVVVLFQILAPTYLSAGNMRILGAIIPELGIVVLGVTVLMIAGEFDLSVGSVFALCPMIIHALTVMVGLPAVVAIPLGLLAACLIGLVNGLVTIRLKIPSFVATLGMMFIGRSMAIVVTAGFPRPMSEDLPTAIFVYDLGVFRASLLWFVGAAILFSILLHATNLGNWIFATGDNRQAAKDMGVPVNRVKVACFMLSSFCAGLAGLIQMMRLKSALPSLGTGLELEAIAAAVIGGTLLSGGVGSILSAVVGAMMIRGIDNGLVMVGVSAEWFRSALGALTIAAVVLNLWVRRTASGEHPD